MAGAFHGVSESDAIINVGVSGPGVVKMQLRTPKVKILVNYAKSSKKLLLKSLVLVN